MKRKQIGLVLLVICLVMLIVPFVSCGKTDYKLSTSCIPAQGGSISPASGTYGKNVGVDIIVSPASGYRFDHWEGDASGTSTKLNIVMDHNKKVVAYFTKVYTLSASCTPSSGGIISPGGGTYDEGTDLTLIATPSQYYKFDGWGGNASGTSARLTVAMNSNKTIVASFSKIMHSLEAQVSPSSGGTVEPAHGTYEAGTQITVVATPASGYRFDHWGGSVLGTSTTLGILMDNNKTLTAYFTRVYTLSVSCSPNDGGSINPVGDLHDEGTEVALTATTLFPYAFSHWSGTDNNTINPTTVTINSDRSVTAYFTKLSPGAQQTISGQEANQKSIPIQIQAGQWLQGQISATPWDMGVQIKDVNGTVVKELGRTRLANFTFQAQTSGTYYFVIYEIYGLLYDRYTLTYTIYS